MVTTYAVKDGSFVASAPRLWSDKQLANIGLAANLDVASDGKRFAVLLPAESSGPIETQTHITLVVNFFEELRHRLMPGSK
jgi:hypothetical protein